jgi:deoxyribodipyrimidine photo-lyase
MSKEYENGLFIFRRDLRINDNTALYLANSKCKHIYSVFIFTPEQVSSQNKFKSDNCVQFMIESLIDLQQKIHSMSGSLLCFYGDNETIINNLIDHLNIDYMCFNEDITPYAVERDKKISKLCKEKGVEIDMSDDYYLHPIGSVMNTSNKPYVKFTPYYLTSLKNRVDTPKKLRKINFTDTSKKLPNRIRLETAMQKFTKQNHNILVNGGRTNALKQLRFANLNIKNYAKTRNTVSQPTSELSAYIKFGCVSIREVYHLFKSKKEFIRQLYWRDFYANVLYYYPHVLGNAMNEKYNSFHWNINESWFNKWCNGETGFPIVDASMRQLNETGYMHNRGRLIVSGFLVKILLISWEKGEKYFAKKLVDYDPASNNLNWQWSASTAIDSQPYYRIMNPWRQQEEHDNECEYIKKWIPELRNVSQDIIHNWNTEWSNHKDIKYPKPICDYETQRDKALKMYKKSN